MIIDEFENLTFFNPEIKKRFLNEEYPPNNTRTESAYRFQKYFFYESKKHINNDIAMFDKEQFINLFIEYLKPRKIGSLSVDISRISKYQRWYYDTFGKELKFDISQFSSDEKQQLISKAQYLTKENLYEIIDTSSYDLRTRAALFLAFEGILGEKGNEITTLKTDQLTNNSITIKGERARTIIVPNKLINLLLEVNYQKEQDKRIIKGNPKAKKIHFYDNGYIFKKGLTKDSDPIKISRLGNIAKDILKNYLSTEIGEPFRFIEDSGKIDYCNRIVSELFTSKNNLDKSIFEKLCYRYGQNKSQWYSFKRFLQQDDIEVDYNNDVEHTNIINSILNSTPVNFSEDNNSETRDNNGHKKMKTYDEDDEDNGYDENKDCPDWLKIKAIIGKFGEKLAEQVLLSQYVNVQDVSKQYSLGYDIKAFDSNNNPHFFEVKATGAKHFFISSHELEVANSRLNKYNIIFVHLDNKKREFEYLIINNPIEFFGIDYESLIEKKSILKENFVSSSNFRFDINPKLISESKPISSEIVEKCRLKFPVVTKHKIYHYKSLKIHRRNIENKK